MFNNLDGNLIKKSFKKLEKDLKVDDVELRKEKLKIKDEILLKKMN